MEHGNLRSDEKGKLTNVYNKWKTHEEESTDAEIGVELPVLVMKFL